MARFLQEHHWILTFVGATFVLAMFIVKDEMGEHARQMADTVEAAQSNALLMRQMTGLPVTLSNIQRSIHDLEANIPRKVEPKPDLRPSAPVALVATFPAVDMLTALDTDYNNNNKLLSKLKENTSDLQTRLDKIKARLAWAHKRVNQLANSDSNRESFEDSIDIFETQLDEIDDDLSNLSDAILAVAEKQEKCAERRTEICGKVSLFLYPAGWLLALIGKVLEKRQDDDLTV